MSNPFDRLNQLCDELHGLSLQPSGLEPPDTKPAWPEPCGPACLKATRLQTLSHELSDLHQTIRARDVLYSAMTAHFPAGALALFTPDLRYQLVEGSGIRLLGMNKESMLERSIHEVFS